MQHVKHSPIVLSLARQTALSRGTFEAAKFLRSHGYSLESAIAILTRRKGASCYA